MGLRFGFFEAKYFKPSFVSARSRFMMCLLVNFIIFKVPMLCMQVSSYLPNHLSVRQGGSLLSYLRGLSVLLMEYFLCISLLCFVLSIGYYCGV